MIRTFAAAIFAALALLAFVTPASAYTFTTEDINLTFQGGFTATGNISFTETPYPYSPLGSVFLLGGTVNMALDGTPLTPIPYYNPTPPGYPPPMGGNPFAGTDPSYFQLLPSLPCSPGAACGEFSYSLYELPSDPSDFFFSGGSAQGIVSITSQINIQPPLPDVSPTPLPATLPLFGSGVIALACFALLRKRLIGEART